MIPGTQTILGWKQLPTISMTTLAPVWAASL